MGDQNQLEDLPLVVAVEIITKAEGQQLLDQEVMIVEEKQPQEDKLQEERPQEDKLQEEQHQEDKLQEEQPQEDKPQEEQLKEEEQQEQLNRNHVTVQNMNPTIV